MCALFGGHANMGGNGQLSSPLARPPARHSTPAAAREADASQTDEGGQTRDKRQERERRRFTTRAASSFQKFSARPVPETFGDNQDSEIFGNLRRVCPRVSSIYNLQLREDTVHIKRVARVRRVAQFYTCSCFFLDATLVQTDAN